MYKPGNMVPVEDVGTENKSDDNSFIDTKIEEYGF